MKFHLIRFDLARRRNLDYIIEIQWKMRNADHRGTMEERKLNNEGTTEECELDNGHPAD